MLGFNLLESTERTIAGTENMHMIHNGQMKVFDLLWSRHYIHIKIPQRNVIT